MAPEKFKPWVDLLDAVNVCAANDIKKYLMLEKSGKLYELDRYTYNAIYRNYHTAITYFKSDYFKELNDFDGSRIVNRLKDLCK